MFPPRWSIPAFLWFAASLTARPDPLPGTTAMTWDGDPGRRVVDSIDRYLDARLASVVADRAARWATNRAAPGGFESTAGAQRTRLREILGVVDERGPVALRFTAAVPGSGAVSAVELARGSHHRVYAVAWSVFRGVEAEGLLLVPEIPPRADAVVMADCDVAPEEIAGLGTHTPPHQAFAARLADVGCRVLVPMLLERTLANGGNPDYRRVQHSQRETLWRAAYEMGRTPTGYEVQKALAAADWLVSSREKSETARPLGIAGHGEGGMVAFHAAALDPRFSVALVSGYFQPREQQWREPIGRNAWSYVRDFGDAEIAALIMPQRLLIEDGAYPEVEFTDAHGAAPGRLQRPAAGAVDAEFSRARALLPEAARDHLIKVSAEPSDKLGEGAGREFLASLGLVNGPATTRAAVVSGVRPLVADRQLRQYRQLLEDTQVLMRESPEARRKFWSKVDFKTLTAFTNSNASLRDYFRTGLVGVIPAASVPPAPQSRLLYETNGIRGYEVVLAVHEGLPAYGILVLPAGMKPDERRPVVVCQHGLEGRPADVADPRVENGAYRRYGFRLAEQGFVTFAPQNAYLGGTRFRQVLRKAQPLGLTLWSFIVRQHEVITQWLASQPFVDPGRIAFYGLSYGGKSAMRIPVWVDRYCLSICSADYNEWIWKNTALRSPYSYLWTSEYDMPEWNMGNTFNYAELSWLISPRPFMVERGHDDGVAPDEWVAYEYARTRRHYVKLGIGDRTEIEFFNGPHTINGVGTFEFLRRHLKWKQE